MCVCVCVCAHARACVHFPDAGTGQGKSNMQGELHTLVKTRAVTKLAGHPAWPPTTGHSPWGVCAGPVTKYLSSCYFPEDGEGRGGRDLQQSPSPASR